MPDVVWGSPSHPRSIARMDTPLGAQAACAQPGGVLSGAALPGRLRRE